MASSEKRCLYEVLGLQRDCTADEIRTAYKRQALQRHPDKLVQSGLSQPQATAQFQELVNAYEVLSDPRERAWYDSHRSQILFSDPTSGNSSASVIPDLFSFFSNSVFSGYSDAGKGFYKVYSDVFNKIYGNEINFAQKMGLGLQSIREAPLMGNLDSPYTQVTAFYNYWLGFATVLDFCWVDQYDAMAGINRKSRRVMEDENKKLRKKAKREFNETVRGLAEFVKKRDKRVVDMMVKKNLEMEKKREEEKERKKKLEMERMAKASSYREPDWSRIEDEEIEDEEVDEVEEKKRDEFYCVACGKKFKSEKQWKNHEQSKKHKEKVAELRESFAHEDEYFQAEDGYNNMEENVEDYVVGDAEKFNDQNADEDGFESVEDEIEKIEKKFRDGIAIEEEEIEDETSYEELEEKEDVFDSINHNVRYAKDVSHSLGGDDETSVLEAMLSGRKNRRRGASRQEHTASSTEPNAETDTDFMDYDNRKGTRKDRAAKKGRGKKNGVGSQPEESNGHDNLHVEEFSSHSVAENESAGRGDDQLKTQNNSLHSFAEKGNDIEDDDKLAKSRKDLSQPVDKKGALKKDSNSRSKSSAKGKKAKASSKNSSLTCGTCGEEFESRNKLHKHLGETGHATLKSR